MRQYARRTEYLVSLQPTMRLVSFCIAALILIIGSNLVSAQTPKNPFLVKVDVESAFVRAAPALDAKLTASVFQDNPLLVVSRNLDGTWFEVRRPGRMTNLGWIFNEVLDGDFQPETLPLGDLVTGVIGPKPLTAAPTFAVYLVQGAALRDRPSVQGKDIFDVPPLVTLPVLERNYDGSWLHVNYFGYDGWISDVNFRPIPNLLDIPASPYYPAPRAISVVIIPVELQQAQIDRLRAYINPRREFAAGLETFWWAVFRGEIMPCDAPPELTYYPYGDEDVRELPELQRYTPRLVTAIDDLNASREPLLTCGVVSPETVGNARDNAINARIIFDAALGSLKLLEKDVVQTRR
jgi:hypothetical protein